jgi:hypothetical protein
MANNRTRESEEGPGYGKGGRQIVRRERVGLKAKQIANIATDAPNDLVGCNILYGKGPGFIPPAVEIVGGCNRRDAHRSAGHANGG